MRRLLLGITLFVLTTAAISCSTAVDGTITIKGKITCMGKGVADVFVTDGERGTTTLPNGSYTLSTHSDRTFIYYTLPQGYNSPLESGIPIFYKKIEEAQKSKWASAAKIDFELLKSEQDFSRHMFVVWADPQVIEPAELELLGDVAEDINRTISSEQYKNIPVHGICAGDIVFDRPELFSPYKDVVSTLGIPFYQSLGNHDMDYTGITEESSVKSYQDAFGPAYYSFNRGDIHYIVLDNVFYYGYSYQYMGYIDQRQLDWLKLNLSHVKPGSTVFVTLHIPTRYGESPSNPSLIQLQRGSVVNNKALYSLFEGYNVHILAGHSHTQWNTIISDSIMEHTHAAASAAWWQGPVGLDGTPQGYTIYTVDKGVVEWSFKGVGKELSHQFRSYPVGADPLYPKEFIVNVFNYDPLWRVEWYEDNELMGEMERFYGEDPLAKRLYVPGENKRYNWLGVGKTYHLFKAKPQKRDSKIRVEVTDRFNKKFTEDLVTL